MAFPLAIAGMGLSAAGNIYQIVNSSIEKRKAMNALDALSKQAMPQIGVAPELRNAYLRAEDNAGFGFSAEETAAYNQNLGVVQNTRQRAASDIGGGQIAGVINAMDNMDYINSINKFAAEGARLKQAKINKADEIAGRLQDIRKMNDEYAIQRRMLLEQSYGKAVAQQQTNINDSIKSLSVLGGRALTYFDKTDTSA